VGDGFMLPPEVAVIDEGGFEEFDGFSVLDVDERGVIGVHAEFPSENVAGQGAVPAESCDRFEGVEAFQRGGEGLVMGLFQKEPAEWFGLFSDGFGEAQFAVEVKKGEVDGVVIPGFLGFVVVAFIDLPTPESEEENDEGNPDVPAEDDFVVGFRRSWRGD
jgi:hypothetical protein